MLNVLALLTPEERANLRLALKAIVSVASSVEARLPGTPPSEGAHGGSAQQGIPAEQIPTTPQAAPAPGAPMKMGPSTGLPPQQPQGPAFNLPPAAVGPADQQAATQALPAGFNEAVEAFAGQFELSLNAAGHKKDPSAIRQLIHNELSQRPAASIYRMDEGKVDFCEDAQLFANEIQPKILAL